MSWCVTKRRSLNFSVSLSHNNPSVIRPRWYFELRALFVRPPPRCSSPSCEFECSGSLVMHFQLPNHPGHHLQSSFTSHRFLTTGTLGHVCVVTNEFVSCLEFFLDWPFEESSGTLLKWLISWINTKTLLVWWTKVQWKWTPRVWEVFVFISGDLQDPGGGEMSRGVKLETPILEFNEPIRAITIALSLCGLKWEKIKGN